MIKIKNEVYDVLKWVAMLLLPALASFVKLVFTVWNIPYGDEIAATIMGIDAFLSAILGISNLQYKANNEVK